MALEEPTLLDSFLIFVKKRKIKEICYLLFFSFSFFSNRLKFNQETADAV